MVIDFYDDLGEAYLRSLGENAPSEVTKEAEWREPYDLLDRDFALIIVDGEGREHRKFACHDPGNVAMSEFYLSNVADLPSYAVKVAWANLPVGPDLKPDLEPLTEEERRFVIDERRVHVKTAQMMPGQTGAPMANKGQMRQPMSPGMMSGAAGVSMTGAASPVRSPPLMNASTPTAGSGRTAMGGAAMQQKVGSATSPFDVLRYAVDNWDDLDPYDRHDTAVFLTKSASAGVRVPDHIYKYGGTELNPVVPRLMEARKSYTVNEQTQDNYDRLGKMASAMDPEDVVEALYLIDEQASLTPRYGDGIPDPLLCVYGQVKEAEWSWMHGGDMVNESQLKRFAAAPYCSYNMGELFSDDICNRFKKDPMGTFKGLPVEQQIVVSRLATQSGIHNDGGYFA
jgi:hypothetical protein